MYTKRVGGLKTQINKQTNKTTELLFLSFDGESTKEKKKKREGRKARDPDLFRKRLDGRRSDHYKIPDSVD